MKLKIFFLAFLVLFTPVLSGCWDYEEYENLIQVSGLGYDYDKESNQFTETVQYIPTAKGAMAGSGSSSGPQQKQIVHSVKAKTIYETAGESQQVIYKKLFYGYLKVIVIGEEAAKYKMKEIIEVLDRSPLIRSSSYIVVTSGKAEDSLSTFDTLTAGSAQEIFNLTNLAEPSGAAYPVTVLNMAQMLAIPGLEATAPRVITTSNKQKPVPQGGTEENFKTDLERYGDQRVGGMAAFSGDKLVGWLNDKESMGFGWITGKKLQSYKVSAKSKDTNSEKVFYYRVQKSKGKIKVKIENGKPLLQVDVKVIGGLRKYYINKGAELFLPAQVKPIEKDFAQSIRSDIEAVLRASQKKLKTDIFGFGFALYRKDPKLWKTKYEGKWENIYPDLQVKINVDAKIINTGPINRRLDLK